MSDVVNRNTLEHRKSVNTPEYDPAEWLINPEIPDCPKELWEVSGDEIVEMDFSDQRIYFAEKLALVKKTKQDELRNQVYASLALEGYDPMVFIYATDIKNEAAINGDTARAEYVGQLRTWIDAGVLILDAAWDKVDAIELGEISSGKPVDVFENKKREVEAVNVILDDWLADNPKTSTRTARAM